MENNLIQVVNQEGHLVVSSRQIAEDFEKRHCDLLRDIENVVTQNCVVKNLMIESTYENRGKQYKEYLLTRDGFSLIVMGFTGAKALQWKLKYIEAFNKMEQALKEQALKVPKTYKEALLQLIESEEQKERLLLENQQKDMLLQEQKPKIDYFEAFMANGKTGTTTQLAGYINQYFGLTLSAQTLNKLLLSMGVLNKKVGWYTDKKTGEQRHKGNYIITTKYAGMGWHAYVQGVAEDGTSYNQLRWTNEAGYGIIQLIEKNKQKYNIA